MRNVVKRRTFLKMLFGVAATAVTAPATIVAKTPDSVPFKKLPISVYKTGTREVEIHTRRLKACWSIEAQQDLRSMHNLEAEKELTDFLAEEINREIDMEVLKSLRKVAA